LRQERATGCATGSTAAEDPELAEVVAAWSDLLGPIRAAVLALVQAAKGGGR
jgi:hypothetical protein